MTSTDQLDLDTIEARADAATPGPWGTYQYGGDSLIEIAADIEDTGCGYSARRTIARFDEEPLDNDPAHREWTAEEDWAQVQADAAYIAAMSPEVAKALVAEVRRLRAQVATARVQAIRDLADKADPQHPEVSFFGDHGHEVGAWMRKQAEYEERRLAAEESHVVADDTIWLERRPCGCIVSAVVAIVPGEWTLSTAADVALHFHHTEGERRRAAEAGLTVEPVTGAQYREQFRDRWHCDKHAAPAARSAAV